MTPAIEAVVAASQNLYHKRTNPFRIECSSGRKRCQALPADQLDNSIAGGVISIAFNDILNKEAATDKNLDLDD